MQKSTLYKYLNSVILPIFFIAATYQLCSSRSYFRGDDFFHILFFTRLKFFDFLISPIDVHIVPFHQALTALIYSISPLNFKLATALLLIIHTASWFLFYKILQEIYPNRFNLLVSALFGINVYLIDVIDFWSAGAHRVPYIFLTLVATCAYLRYRKSGEPWLAALCFVSHLLAFGFFIKALLIPVFILAIEASLALKEKSRPSKRTSLLLMAMLFSDAIYVLWYLKFAPVLHLPFLFKFGDIFNLSLIMLRICSQELLPAPYHSGYTEAFCIISWGAFLLWRAIRAPTNIVIFMIGLSILLINILLIVISPRGALFAFSLGTAHRYYLETVFMVLPFLVMMFRPSGIPANPDRTKPAYAVPEAVTTIGLIGYFILSYATMSARFQVSVDPLAATLNQSHIYMANLRRDLRETRAVPDRSILDGTIPVYAKGFPPPLYRSDVIPLTGTRVHYDLLTQNLYSLDPIGRMLRVELDDRVLASRDAPATGGTGPCLRGEDLALSATGVASSSSYVAAVIHYDTRNPTNLTVSFAGTPDGMGEDQQRSQVIRLDPQWHDVVAVYGGAFVPLPVPDTVNVKIDAPSNDLCVTRVALRTFREVPIN